MKTRKKLGVLALVACISVSVSAKTVVYDLNEGFGTPQFQYGQGAGGTSFAEFTNVTSCQGPFLCYSGNVGGPSTIHNPTDEELSFSGDSFGTRTVPARGISMSAGVGPNGNAVVRFIVPSSQLYSLNASILRFGVHGAHAFSNYRTSGGIVTLLSGASGSAGGGYQSIFGFSFMRLLKGDTIDFAVLSDNSVGLSGVFMSTSVPEPRAWSMMIIGFGLTGSVIRRQRCVTAVSVAP